MSAKTLDAMTVSNPAAAIGTSGTIRYYADQDFTAFDGTQYLAGAVDSLDYFLSNTWSIVGGDLVVPSLANFPSTDDAIEGNGVRITAAIYDTAGKRRGLLFDSFRIHNSLPSTISLSQLVLANGAKQLLRDTGVWTKEQTIDYVTGAVDTAIGTLPIITQPITLLDSSNAILTATFNVIHNWGTIRDANGMVEFKPQLTAPSTNFNYIAAHLSRLAAGGSAGIIYNAIIPVDCAERYRLGAIASSDNGTESLRFTLQLVRRSVTLDGTTITQDVTPPSNAAMTLSNADNSVWINDVLGAPPSWLGTEFCFGTFLTLSHNTASVSTIYIYGVYLVPDTKLPTTTFTQATANTGWGTHEATTDGTYLYVVSHAFATVTKYDKDLIRQAITTTAQYPHDIMIFSGSLWVVNYTGASMQKFNLTTLALEATYPLLAGRKGLGLGNDGTYIYIGCGESGSDAVLKFNPATAVDGTTTGQSVLSTDTISSASNMPIVYLDGSVWSNNFTLGTVKRIHPTTGATIATIQAGVASLYGLGTDGDYLYASCVEGVFKVDPATNTVIKSWRFRNGYIGASNPKYDSSGGGRMWGITTSGASVYYIDLATDNMVETENLTELEGGKWVQPMEGWGTFTGFYSYPYMNRYAPVR